MADDIPPLEARLYCETCLFQYGERSAGRVRDAVPAALYYTDDDADHPIVGRHVYESPDRPTDPKKYLRLESSDGGYEMHYSLYTAPLINSPQTVFDLPSQISSE